MADSAAGHESGMRTIGLVRIFGLRRFVLGWLALLIVRRLMRRRAEQRLRSQQPDYAA